MTHLTADELVDALDDALEAGRQAHLEACESCRQQVVELGATLGATRDVEVPEPSPLYWEHLSRRVRTAIDAEPPTAGGGRGWLRWPVLAPVAALALLVMALAVSLPREAPIARAVAINEAADTAVEDSFAVVADLVGDLDWDTAVSAGLIVSPGAADRAVLDLTALEQRELARLLQAELTRAKS